MKTVTDIKPFKKKFNCSILVFFFFCKNKNISAGITLYRIEKKYVNESANAQLFRKYERTGIEKEIEWKRLIRKNFNVSFSWEKEGTSEFKYEKMFFTWEIKVHENKNNITTYKLFQFSSVKRGFFIL